MTGYRSQKQYIALGIVSLILGVHMFFPYTGVAAVRCPTPPKKQKTIEGLLFNFLPEASSLGKYLAPRLVLVDPVYTIEGRPACLTKETYDAFVQLNTAMKADINKGVFVRSGWRSYETQIRTLRANPTLAAQPGRSEHQLGTAIDFSHVHTQEREEAFYSTPQYQWMLENAHRYGFVETYGEWNAVESPWEPWHWRYVGTTVATEIYETNDDVLGYLNRRVLVRMK